MKKTEAIKAITTAYTRLYEIDDAAALRREGLTLAEYHAAGAIFNDLNNPGSESLTLSAAVAAFFGRCGYTVTPAGVNYKIAC